MFLPKDTDFESLDSYRFAWRWTDPERVSIPDDDLAGIRPLAPETARQAYEYCTDFQGTAYWTRFQEVDELAVDGRGTPATRDRVQAWLDQRLPATDSPVFVSWTERQAVQTTRDLLIRYWDTFCYPVEDVVIWPADESWVLLFDYKQRFYFAEAKP